MRQLRQWCARPPPALAVLQVTLPCVWGVCVCVVMRSVLPVQSAGMQVDRTTHPCTRRISNFPCDSPMRCAFEALEPAVTPGGCDLAGKYDLSHLTQPREQNLLGPIQVGAGCWAGRAAAMVHVALLEVELSSATLRRAEHACFI